MLTRIWRRCARNVWLFSRSGETYSSLVLPYMQLFSTPSTSCRVMPDMMQAAAMCRPRSWLTWSFISAISGETTSVSPSIASAGSW